MHVNSSQGSKPPDVFPFPNFPVPTAACKTQYYCLSYSHCAFINTAALMLLTIHVLDEYNLQIVQTTRFAVSVIEVFIVE
jgi:hypothetical protein